VTEQDCARVTNAHECAALWIDEVLMLSAERPGAEVARFDLYGRAYKPPQR
jgi:hypothetical protein